jgi:hypothetical protein
MVRNSAVTPLKSSSIETCASSVLRTNAAVVLRSDPPKQFPSISEDSLMEKPIFSIAAHMPNEQHSAADKTTSSDSRSTQSTSEGLTLTPSTSDDSAAVLRSQLAATTIQPQISEVVPKKTSMLAGPCLLQVSTEEPELKSSNLFRRETFETDEPTDLMNQNEYFTHDTGTPTDISSMEDKGYKDFDTPPTSIHNTPTGIFSKPSTKEFPLFSDVSGALDTQLPPPSFQLTGSSVVSQTSMAGSHVENSMASSADSSGMSHRPVLYSAIGSLEDPSTNSYGRSNRRPVSKYEFPSSRLLPPANQMNHGRFTSSTSKTPKSRNTDPAQKRENSKQGASETGQQQRVRNGGSNGDRASSSSPAVEKKPSNLKAPASRPSSKKEDDKGNKKVTIVAEGASKPRRVRKKKVPAEMFRPSSDAYTPRMGKKQIKYKPAEMRTPVQQMASPLGTLSRPNFRDALRRVAMIIRQHIIKIERRFESKTLRHDDGLFLESMRTSFSEEAFVTPTYKCTMVRVPMARGGMVYGLKKVRRKYEIPTEAEIYEFGHQLFKTVQLSSECSIVCLIYIERLMEVAKVPLMSDTWRPIVMCGLLLASKVWQDLSSWNIEFASVYPQYPLDAINRLELHFLRSVKWDLYISSSQYAKYYFALRSLVEKSDFRQRYNRMVGGVDSVQADEALKIQKRSSMVKEEALLQLSRSM